MAFIETLGLLMNERGVSRNRFCADIGINKNAVANWENRRNIPDGAVLAKIAAYFGVTTDYLLSADKPATPEGQPVTKREELMYEARKELADLPENDLERILEMVRAYKRK